MADMMSGVRQFGVVIGSMLAVNLLPAIAFSQGEKDMDCRSTATDVTRFHAILEEAARPPSSLVSIHAAESLIRLGKGERLLPDFRVQFQASPSAYQVGVWRVLARIEDSESNRAAAVQRIRRTLLDESSAFQIHAMESLAKLRIPIQAEEAETVRRVADEASHPGAPFALWRLSQHPGSEKDAVAKLTALLRSEQEVIRFRAAYTLWHLRPLPSETMQALNAEQVISDSPANGTLGELQCLMFALAGGQRGIWESFATSEIPAARYFVALELAEHQDDRACALLRSLLADSDLDVRAAAAFSLLKQL